ncbi:MAG: hypothetical protein IPN11_03185 [Opitutaceae bacterium]|nr:hypothetical protein [Opitutaceae bacterium]
MHQVPLRCLARGVVSFGAGNDFSVWVQADGTLWGTGGNGYGQLGTGTTETVYAPRLIATDVATVVAGEMHVLFVKYDGTLWGMGRNYEYQLGTGTNANCLNPVLIAAGVTEATASSTHSLFRKSDGTVWAMGSNTYGCLGDGTQQTRSAPVQVAVAARKLAAGSGFSALLKPDGSLWLAGQVYSDAFPIYYHWTKIADGIALATPDNPTVQASKGTVAQGVALTWTPVRGATGYEVWRGADANPATAAYLFATGPVPFAVDADTETGIPCHYWLKAISLTGMSGFGAGDVGWRGAPQLPNFTLQPVGGTVQGTVMLTVAANGDPVPTYRWRKWLRAIRVGCRCRTIGPIPGP